MLSSRDTAGSLTDESRRLGRSPPHHTLGSCACLKYVVPIVAEGCEDVTGDVCGVDEMKAALPDTVTVVPFSDLVEAGAKAPCEPTPPTPAEHAVIMYVSLIATRGVGAECVAAAHPTNASVPPPSTAARLSRDRDCR